MITCALVPLGVIDPQQFLAFLPGLLGLEAAGIHFARHRADKENMQ